MGVGGVESGHQGHEVLLEPHINKACHSKVNTAKT